jgi:hypothetical protein
LGPTSIRLLTVHGGPPAAPLALTLAEHPASTAPAYDALSYAWGDRRRLACPVTVNGVWGTVFAGLGAALQGLRDEREDRVLWVDALCIDLDEEGERSRFAGRVGGVYRRARQVRVWLGGEGGSGGEDGVEEAWSDGEVARVVEMVRQRGEDRHLGGGYGKAAEERLRPLKKLFAREWWSRMWVLEEVALAQAVIFHCDRSTTFTWEELHAAYAVHARHSRTCCVESWTRSIQIAPELDIWAPVADFIRLVTTLRADLWRYNFLDMLLLCRRRRANDPRDKIYGLLSLYDPKGVRRIRPDYSLTVADTYQRATWKLMSGFTGLEVLMHVFASSQRAGLPSWVPDWGTADYNPPASPFSAPMYLHTYDACASAAPAVKTLPPTTLRVRALSIDTIATASQMLRTLDLSQPSLGPVSTDLRATVHEWEALAGLTPLPGAPYVAGDAATCDAFWRTLLMDVVHDPPPPLTPLTPTQTRLPIPPPLTHVSIRRVAPADQAAYLRWRGWVEAGGDADGAGLAPDAGATAVHDAVVGANSARRFFRTSAGRLGMGPLEMRVGDRVVVLAGAKQPFVVRAWEGEQGVWEEDGKSGSCVRLVGFAYLHGVMDGEAVRGQEWENAYLR